MGLLLVTWSHLKSIIPVLFKITVESSFLIRWNNYYKQHLIGSVIFPRYGSLRNLIRMLSISDYKYTSQYLVNQWTNLDVDEFPRKVMIPWFTFHRRCDVHLSRCIDEFSRDGEFVETNFEALELVEHCNKH